jgi:hypothetical protein
MYETKLHKVERASPRRCQASIPHGQCQYEVFEDTHLCAMHGGPTIARSQSRVQVRNYRLTRYKARVEEFAEAEGVKSLREEIGILRMIMEEIINKCRDSEDLLMYSSKISDLAVKIEKTVVSCHRLESSLGYMMDKAALLTIATQIVNIVNIYIKDENTLDAIINDIMNLIEKS